MKVTEAKISLDLETYAKNMISLIKLRGNLPIVTECLYKSTDMMVDSTTSICAVCMECR